MKVKVFISGCDDTTEFEIKISKTEEKFLKKLCALSEGYSQYTCQPKMSYSYLNKSEDKKGEVNGS